MRCAALALALVALAGCAADRDSHDYLDPAATRASVIASLTHDVCGHGMRVIEDSRYYWVGLCQNRSAFEDRVFFMAFDSTTERDDYLARLESCFSEGRYTQGPRWFAMTVTRGDTSTLRRDGAAAVRCRSHVPTGGGAE